MNIVFVEPNFPRNQREFARALHEVGATVFAVGETPWEWLDEQLQSWIDHYYQVGSVTDVDQLRTAVEHFQSIAWIDGMEATIEAHTLAANIAHYGLEPVTNIAVHGSGPLSIAQTLANNQRQIDAAVEYCRTTEQGGRFVFGCPVQYDTRGPLPLTPR